MHNPLPMSLKHASGFSLVELAIVLIIIALLSGGLMMSLGAQLDNRDNNNTQQQLLEARDALLGFAASHTASGNGKPYLPCPDTDGDGSENRVTGTNDCTNEEGFLPWTTLGLGRQDAWNNRFRYRVSAANFAHNQTGFTLGINGTMRVCEQAGCSSNIATGIPAIILSHGKNGLGATTADGIANAATSSLDEAENSDNDTDFVSHTPSPAGTSEFDDIVVWLSPNILYSRMIAAGKLP